MRLLYLFNFQSVDINLYIGLLLCCYNIIIFSTCI